MTVTVTAELIPPSTDVTVISAHPSETPVTMPSSETVATEGSDEANVTAFSVAFSGKVQTFLEALSGYQVLTLENIPQTLDETFSCLYGGDFHD